jgi:hypothetical protein
MMWKLLLSVPQSRNSVSKLKIILYTLMFQNTYYWRGDGRSCGHPDPQNWHLSKLEIGISIEISTYYFHYPVLL